MEIKLENCFYKFNTVLLKGQHIYGNGYILLHEQKDTYTYPIDGWYWFETEAEAKTFFGIE